MPFYKNVQTLTSMMRDCDDMLDTIFADFQLNRTFKTQLNQIKIYYKRTFISKEEVSERITVLEEYENFISTVKQVKDGEILAEQALEAIKESTENRQVDIIIDNIVKVFEIILLAAVTAALYSACITISLPLIFCEPILGATFFFSSIALMTMTVDSLVNCFEEIKSLESVNMEEQRERNLISFFNPSVNNKDNKSQIKENDEERSDTYSITATYQ